MAKILVVDDDEMNRDMLSRRLLRKGYEVALAVNGAEAIEKARSEKPELILMDLSMPVLDGYEATSHWMTRSLLPIFGARYYRQYSSRKLFH